jgi:hypothetical protein
VSKQSKQTALKNRQFTTQINLAKKPNYMSTGATRYDRAYSACEEVVKLCEDGKDKLLEIDAYNLQAICKYRLHLPLEAVQCFNKAKLK